MFGSLEGVDGQQPRGWSLSRPSRVLVAQGRWAELEDAPVPAPALPVQGLGESVARHDLVRIEDDGPRVLLRGCPLVVGVLHARGEGAAGADHVVKHSLRRLDLEVKMAIGVAAGHLYLRVDRAVGSAVSARFVSRLPHAIAVACRQLLAFSYLQERAQR